MDTSTHVFSEIKESSDMVLDLKGLNCPLPILRTKQQLNKMQAGEIVTIWVTDPHAEIDFKAYLARVNHDLIHFSCELDSATQKAVYIFQIRKN
jgi:tRNA 2-thiouridine synthesizing protein A